MEDMRPVLVDKETFVVIAVVGVPAYMVSLVDDQNAIAALRRETFGQHASREAGADDKPVKHCAPPPSLSCLG